MMGFKKINLYFAKVHKSIELKAAPIPKKKDLYFLRFLIIFGLVYLFLFVRWFFSSNLPGNIFLYVLISLGLIYKLLRIVHEWIYLFFLPFRRDEIPLKSNFKVDVFTTYCPGEPIEMVKETLTAILKINHPHGTILCSEGNNDELQNFCEQRGIKFIPRYERTNAKAGNINNALKFSDAEICLILDPDHKPHPQILDEILPHFENTKIGFVQIPQIYYNHAESAIALGAAQQTYEFYGPLMTSMGRLGNAQAIGANCAFRRKALDSIGGHAPGLTEDMHTSMLLHAKGWKSKFVPIALSEGLVPSNKSTYYLQQLKWSRGSFDLLFKVFPKIAFKLSFGQILHYLSIPLYFLFGLFALFDIAVPIISLWSGVFPLKCSINDLFSWVLPLIFLALFIKTYAQKWYYFEHEKGFHFYAEVLRIGVWWINLLGFIYAIFNKKVPYIPTPKESDLKNEWRLSIPNFIVVFLLLISAFYGLNNDWSEYAVMMSAFAIFLAFMLFFDCLVGLQIFYENIRIKKEFLSNRIKSSVAFILFLSSTLCFFSYQLYFSKIIGNINLVKPPEYKYIKNNFIGFKNNNDKKANLFVKNMSVSDNADINYPNDQFLYLRYDESILDTTGLNNLIQIWKGIKSPFFIEIPCPSDSNLIKSKNFEWIYKTLYNKSLNQSFRPIFVFSFSKIWQLDKYFPDEKYVDWINYVFEDSLSLQKGNFNYDFEKVFFKLSLKKKPVLVSNLVVNRNENIEILEESVLINYKELSGFLLRKSDENNFNFHTLSLLKNHIPQTKKNTYNYKLLDEFSAIHYNSNTDWNNAFYSNSINDIREDFKLIKSLEMNAVLRFGAKFSDKNIFKAAKEQNLKIVYAFIIPPKTDFSNKYSLDTLEDEALKIVKKYSQEEVVLTWVLGHNVISDINNFYAEPLASIQKINYLKWVEQLSKKIKSIDENTIISIHLPSDENSFYHLKLISQYLQTLDAIGLNLYYAQDTAYVNKILSENAYQFYISSYSIDGYKDKNKVDFYEFRDTDSLLIRNALPLPENEILQKNLSCIYSYISSEKRLKGAIYNKLFDEYGEKLNWDGLLDYKKRKKFIFSALNNVINKKEISSFYGQKHQIISQQNYVEEDSIYTFTLSGKISDDEKIEWLLCNEDAIPLKINFAQKENTVRFKIPNDDEDLNTYRLYAFISKNDSVRVVSYLLPLRWYFH